MQGRYSNLNYLSSGSVAEQLVSSVPIRIEGVMPDAALAGTITLRDGSAADGSGTVIGVIPVGAAAVLRDYLGAKTTKGLTVQFSNVADKASLFWNPLP